LPLVVPYGASVPPIEVTVRHDTGEIEVSIERRANQVSSPPNGGTTNSAPMSSAVTQPGNVSLYCVPIANQAGPVRESQFRANGQVTLSSLPPGDYRVLVFDTPQQFEYRSPSAMRAYESKGQVARVAAGQKAQVRVQVIESE
jgi:hypothetical protein